MTVEVLDYEGLKYYTEKLKIDSLPIGFIGYFPAEEMPLGFLMCNGQAVNRVMYSDLFSIIGTTYGQGNGVTTFNIPDLVNKQIETDVDDVEFGLTDDSLFPCIKALGYVTNASQVDAVTVVQEIADAADKAMQEIDESVEQIVDQVVDDRINETIEVITEEEIDALFE